MRQARYTVNRITWPGGWSPPPQGLSSKIWHPARTVSFINHRDLIRIGDIHFDRNTIATRNRKAGKAMPERPIPGVVMTELANHVAALPDKTETLFADKFSPKRWNRVRKAMGLPALRFHDLRKTFASLLAQRGVSTAVTQRLLEHSSPRLTNEVYTNIDPVLR